MAKFKCPCCNNPWNADGEGDGFAGVCSPCLSRLDDKRSGGGLELNNFDNSICCQDNFFLWANGGWMKSNPIPPEYSSWNTFYVLRDLNLERLKTILDELSTEPHEPAKTSNRSKLSLLFAGFMDEEKIENHGIDYLKPIITECLHGTDVAKTLASLHRRCGVKVLFSLYSEPDRSNSSFSIARLTQAGLGLPDRDYYFDKDKEDKRVLYLEYAERLFVMLGEDGISEYSSPESCASAARSLFEFESVLAKSHLTKTELRDPEKTFNKMPLSQVISTTTKSSPSTQWASYLSRGVDVVPFDWNFYFQYVGKPVGDLCDVNLSTITAVQRAVELSSSSKLGHYLAFHVVNSFAPHLPERYATAHFNFHKRDLTGTKEQLPRWKRALEFIESSMGQALGKFYVQKYFPESAKERALNVVLHVKEALRDRLSEVDWMSAETKAKAQEKMEAFKVKIGYPDSWINYENLVVSTDSHLANVASAAEFDYALDLSRINAPTDRSRWFMTPQTVNAYYHPMMNEIVFPAAILQPPFFDPDADLAMQYGSMGAVVGHEMTHGFDDQGRKYDAAGNMRDWWTAEDGKEYEKRVDVMIRQAEQFQVHGLFLKGKLTCGENIADLGGLKLALRALRRSIGEEDLLRRPADGSGFGFSPLQRLFLSWAQLWRGNITEERAKQLVTIDPHGPHELRCNGTLSNISEFFEAFDVKEGNSMFRPRENRVDVW